MRTQIARLPMIAGMAIGWAGCDALGLGSDESVSVSFAVPASQTANNTAFNVQAVPITVGGHTLDLQNADVTFTEITLERAEGASGGDSDGDSDSDSDSDGSSNEKLRRTGTTISLPMQGGVITPINEALPTGSYEEIEMDVSVVRLRGTFDGQAFDVTVPVNAELEIDFSPPFEVDSNDDRLNITVQIDPSLWLRRTEGSLIDPRLLASDATLRAFVANRIRQSFKAFEDSDRDADETDSDSDSDGRD